MKIAIVLGTRPEIIKMAPVIRACIRRGVDFFILHTGQHYSANMDEVFFDELALPRPRYNLGVGNQPHRKQVGLMTKFISEVFVKERPDAVVVQGDTISVLAAALAAKRLGLKVAHHEAGLRSHDPSMLEETNRVTTDHLSDFLFAPTEDAMNNLKEEGYDHSRIFYTGNTIVDAVNEHRELAEHSSHILEDFGLRPKEYILATAHRPENVDKSGPLAEVLDTFAEIARAHGALIYPMHPRTRNTIERHGLAVPTGIAVKDPLSYLDFLKLASHARLIVTDSGGVQEEACILKVPCVTIRKNTERPETVRLGMNCLAGGAGPGRTAALVGEMLRAPIEWVNPFGTGNAGEEIVRIITTHEHFNNNSGV